MPPVVSPSLAATVGNQILHFAAASTQVPPVEPDPVGRLGKLLLEGELKETLEDALADFGLSLEEVSLEIPDLGRKLELHRAGRTGFAVVPAEFLEEGSEANLLQVGLLERTLMGEIDRLLIFSDADHIDSAFTKRQWRRWQIKKVFELVDGYDGAAVREFLEGSRDERINQLAFALDREPGATPPEAPAEPEAVPDLVDSVFLRDLELGLLHDLVRQFFGPAELGRLLRYRLEKEMHNYAATSDNFPTAVDKVLIGANQQGWVERLILEIHLARPNSAAVANFAASVGVALPNADTPDS